MQDRDLTPQLSTCCTNRKLQPREGVTCLFYTLTWRAFLYQSIHFALRIEGSSILRKALINRHLIKWLNIICSTTYVQGGPEANHPLRARRAWAQPPPTPTLLYGINSFPSQDFLNSLGPSIFCTGLSKKMDGIWNRYNLKSTGRIYTFGVLKYSEKFKVLDLL